jgi:CrcB protein
MVLRIDRTVRGDLFLATYCRGSSEGVGVVSDERIPAASDPAGKLRGLPIDPDVDGPESPPRRRPTSRWPRLAPGVLLAVFLGGVLGGGARYGIGLAAPPAINGFPWDIFAINLSGAFALSMLLVLVLEVFPPTRYVRPALGTGFIGAFTTFSSMASATDHLLAHGHPMLAIAYTIGSLFGGLAAASLGLACGRAVSANRHRARAAEGASS